MPSSSLATIAEGIPASAIQNIASQFGASEHTVLDGVQSSVAAVISGLSQKSDNQSFLSQILQSAAGIPESGLASGLNNGALANPASSFLTGAKQFLSNIFGDKLGSLTEAIAARTGLRSAAAATLLAVGAHAVLSYLGNKVRDGSLNASTFPALLAKEGTVLQGMLPAGFFSQAVHTHKVEVDPVVAQTVSEEKSRSPLLWLIPLLLAVLLLGYWWYRSHQQSPAAPQAAAPTAPAAASIPSSTGADLGALIDVK
ncbi:MAG: DUF937 domain-containing protein, partial [Acidobacteriaceae bacterium]